MTYNPKITGTVAKNGALSATADFTALDDKLTGTDSKITSLDARITTLDVKLDTLMGLVQELASSSGDTGGGGTTPPPPDTNAYPLRMAADHPPGTDVFLGAGNDALQLIMRVEGAITPEQYGSVAVLMDGSAIAVLDVSADGWHNQNFEIKGSWGPPAPAHVIGFVPGGKRNGLQNVTLGSLSYNFAPGGLEQDTIADARGSVTPRGSLWIWDNIGVPFNFMVPRPTQAPPPPPPPVLAQDVIKDGKTLQQLVDETPSGGVLALPAGTFHGEAKTRVPMTILGATGGGTILSGEGGQISNGKALINALAHLEVEDIHFTRASVADHNGAAIRPEPNCNLTMRNCEVDLCENGLLTPGDGSATVLIEDCNFHDNGFGRLNVASATHQVYIGKGTSEFTARRTIFKCGPLSTHAVKSRAPVTNLADCHLTGNGDDGSVGGSVLNTPDGGEVNVTGTRITRVPGAGNTQFMSHATESLTHGPGHVTLDAVTVENGGKFESLQATAPMTILPGCTHVGSAPEFAGFVVEGQFEPA